MQRDILLHKTKTHTQKLFLYNDRVCDLFRVCISIITAPFEKYYSIATDYFYVCVLSKICHGC